MPHRRLLGALLIVPTFVAFAASPSAASTSPQPSTIAVIGDIPYGSDLVAAFPTDIAQINADPDVMLVAHLGDIKSGSSVCSDTYFSTIRSDFDTFQDPLVYTPGDNEWTDCHRAAAGGYLPTERLAKLREVFFPIAGQTLGVNAMSVRTQASDPSFSAYLENTMWTQSGVVLSAVNLPGSNNDLVPWFGLPITQAQRDEYDARLAADLEWITTTFNRARQTGAYGVVLLMQADMWDTSALGGDGLWGFDPIVQRIGKLAAKFGRPVLLLEGDSHVYRVDHPFTPTDALYALHPLVPATLEAPNVTRVVVDGSSNAFDYLKLTIDPTSASVFSWTRVFYS